MMSSPFVPETEAYALLARAGLRPPRFGVEGGPLPFEPGEPVVLKGLGENVWHKSELGAVHFLPFERQTVLNEFKGMHQRLEAGGHRWMDGLVCEQIDIARCPNLPSEALVSLTRGEAGWTVVFGFGGLQADTLAELAPPRRWPVALTSVTEALAELETHLLGRIWLGRIRGTKELTDRATLEAFLRSLWILADVLEKEGLTLLELNPVALDVEGLPRPLDAVGSRGPRPAPRLAPPAGFLTALTAPGRIALAGVSVQEGGVGRIILENLTRCPLPAGDLLIIKPSHDELLGLPCLPDVSALKDQPVDLLLLALPAVAAVETLEKLIKQGGGARCVALVAGGIGDGADNAELGLRVAAALHLARTAGRWTPAVLGPNFLGHWVPARRLNSSFIPAGKLAAPSSQGGDLTLLSQSGAFLLCLQSRLPALRFGLGLALGNQLDVALCDVLAALAAETKSGPVAGYVEGFGPGQLPVAAAAIQRLCSQGRPVVLHRAGRTAAGQAAAASHTGAMASDPVLERALLERAGARFADSIADFDAALVWLAAYPRLPAGPVALVSNAGFECVNGSDLLDRHGLTSASLDGIFAQALTALLQRHGLAGLVTPRLPLDLTPMAGPTDFIAATSLLIETAGIVVIGLVPFTPRLDTTEAGATKLARMLAALRDVHHKPIGLVVDAGVDYAGFRAVLQRAGLPVFDRMESALRGLRVFNR
jgi:acyl-CoA synthetase (NDP forming)